MKLNHMGRAVFLLFFFLGTASIDVYSQKLDYLNKYWYPIKDAAVYKYAYFRITLEDSVRKSVRIISADSVLSYQLVEIKDQKQKPLRKTEVWFTAKGSKSSAIVFTAEKNRKETARYYDSGEPKSVVITENDEVVEETYFSRSGEKIEKPVVVNALPFRGIEGWTDYLRKNLTYPETARMLDQEGLVYLHFYVTEEGKMEEIEVMNPEENHPLLNQEALRVSKAYPHNWTPSLENGVPVKSEMRLPIRFKLSD